MGNYIFGEGKDTSQLKSKNTELIKNFRRRLKLEEIISTMKIYVEEIYPETRLDVNQFDDVFCNLLNNTKPVFDLMQEEGKVDIYQVFIAMAVFSQGNFDDKIKSLFCVFDLDGNGDIERRELSCFIMSGVNGLCKMTGLPQPSTMGIQTYTVAVFKEIDEDQSGIVDYEEFQSWIKNSDPIQEFLLKFTGVQTFERSVRRKNEEFKQWTDIFDECAVEFMDDQYTEADILRKSIDKKMPHIQKQILDSIFHIMTYEGNKVIRASNFFQIMLPMACFSATDINNDNELDVMELKNLFWLLDDKEPENARVQKEMKAIDKDGGGSVDRLEWIAYLVSPDPVTGSSYFDFELRNSFMHFDDNADGFINLQEFAAFLKEDVKHLLAGVTMQEVESLNKIFESHAREMKKLLTSEEGGGARNVISWNEFKLFRTRCKKRREQLCDFLKSAFDVDDDGRKNVTPEMKMEKKASKKKVQNSEQEAI